MKLAAIFLIAIIPVPVSASFTQLTRSAVIDTGLHGMSGPTPEASIPEDGKKTKAPGDASQARNVAISLADASASKVGLSPAGIVTKPRAQDLELTNVSPADLLSATNETSKLVWILGCSIDHFATQVACQNENAVIQIQDANSFYCTSHGLTLIFTFYPGASPPPYYQYNNMFAHTTTPDIIRSQAQRIDEIFLKPPDAIIVDSSLWDIANWWTKDGSPSHHWRASQASISHWCHETIPTFLKFVQEIVPHSRIAFRSIPPVFNTDWQGYLCNVSEAIDEMNQCLLKSEGTVTHQLYDKYSLIDWNPVVQSTVKALGGPLRALYNDDVHPGLELVSAYMAVALTWAKGL